MLHASSSVPCADSCPPLLRPRSPLPLHARPVHYLDFKGRVTCRSTKNFQLVHWDHNAGALGTELAMQFGKRSGDEFVLDFAWPLSALQAFSLGGRGWADGRGCSGQVRLVGVEGCCWEACVRGPVGSDGPTGAVATRSR